jgi:hypothetical protein
MHTLILSSLRRLAAGLVMSAGLATEAAPLYQPAVQAGVVTASQIDEASGLAASRRNPGVLWTHNDSGDSSRIFAISTTGGLLGQFNLTGAAAFDWEDIAVGPGPAAGSSYIFVGDIGDNSALRPSVQVYRVPEPVVTIGGPVSTTALSGVETLTLTYPDGPRNAETLMVDQLSGDLYIVTKSNFTNERVYRAAAPAAGSNSITLEYLMTLSIVRATGGSMAPDGSALIVRTLTQAFEFDRSAGQSWQEALAAGANSFALHSEEQGEAIAFASGTVNSGFYTVSEGSNQPLYFYAPVPEPAASLALLFLSIGIVRSRRGIL